MLHGPWFAECTPSEPRFVLGKLGRFLLRAVQSRHPVGGEQMTAALSDNAHGQHLQEAQWERFLNVGLGAPPWEDLQRGAQPRQNEIDDAKLGLSCQLFCEQS